MRDGYGKGVSKDPIHAFHEELSKHLDEQGIYIPKTQDVSPEAIEKSGFLSGVDSFFKKNNIAWLSITKATGAALVAHSATKKETYNPSKMIAGTLYSAAWWATFALDKPHAPPYQFKSKDGGDSSQSLAGWLADNPRARITAPVGMATNLLKLYGAGDEGMKAYKAMKAATTDAERKFTKAKRYDFVWNVVAYSAALVAAFMFGKSGGGKSAHKDDPEGFERDLLAVSANLLAEIPEKARKQAIASAAEYVTSIKGINHSQTEVEQMITNQIHHLQQLGVTPPAHAATLSV